MTVYNVEQTYQEHFLLCLDRLTAAWSPQCFQERLFFSCAHVTPAQLLKSRRSRTQWTKQKLLKHKKEYFAAFEQP